MKADERFEVTKFMLADEIERATTVRPIAVKAFGQINPNANIKRRWHISQSRPTLVSGRLTNQKQ